MKRDKFGICILVISVCGWATQAWPQEPTTAAPTALVSAAPVSESQVPRLVKFSGTLLDESGKPRTGVAGVTFLLYKGQAGGAPLWMETQNVNLDAKGHYTILLGSSKPDGLPAELFATGEARWLAVQGERQPEQPRVLLLSVPYALKAMDAETLGGRPVSDFALSSPQAGNAAVATTATPQAGTASSNPVSQTPGLPPITGSGTKNFIPIWTSSSALGNSTMFETGGKIGVGTTSPADTFQITAPNQLGLMVQGPITGAGAGIDLQTTGSGGTEWEILATGNTSAQGVGKFNIRDVNTGQDRLTIAPGGIGIGNTKPTFTLDVNGNTNVSGTLFAKTATLSGLLASGPINVFNSVVQDGIFVKSQGANTIGVNANTPNGTVAVLATIGTDAKFANAVQGQANGTTQETIGVWGITDSSHGIGTLGTAVNKSAIAAGIEGCCPLGTWGDTGSSAGGAAGLIGTADDARAIYLQNNSPSGVPTLFAFNSENTTHFLPVMIEQGAFGSCDFDTDGNLACTGNITPTVPVKQGTRQAALYTMASPENWFEDFGSGRLSNGSATIALDADFAETVNTGVDYHVFLTPNGESKGLYVSQKGPSSFEVRESGGGSSSISFDYRIVAHRKGQEGVRMADMTERMQHHDQLTTVTSSVEKLP